ncbi:MAG: response regulator [Caldimonas sp.]
MGVAVSRCSMIAAAGYVRYRTEEPAPIFYSSRMRLANAAKLLVDVGRRASRGWVRPPAPGEDPARATPVLPTLPRRSCLRVLVVDDCPINRTLASEMLSWWGVEPATAANGARAVILVREREFDLILMDLDMPVMDGLEATSCIRRLEREHPDRPRVPIVAYTSGRAAGNMELMRRVGLDGALEKPCGADAMEACLARWCAARPAPAPAVN